MLVLAGFDFARVDFAAEVLDDESLAGVEVVLALAAVEDFRVGFVGPLASAAGEGLRTAGACLAELLGDTASLLGPFFDCCAPAFKSPFKGVAFALTRLSGPLVRGMLAMARRGALRKRFEFQIEYGTRPVNPMERQLSRAVGK